ncbi:PAS domain-containing protein [Thalassobaculum sp.]|uniref:PAS domain-containing protein n=1 Tax=Thalassobaculum sp. TaxID=2022740 RepID=UPI0032EBC61C
MLDSPDDLVPADAPGDLRRLAAYWIARAAGRRMPCFEDIDPVDLPWALSRLFVVRAMDGGADFEYRLAGQEIYERHGGSIVGKRAGDLFRPAGAAAILARWRRVVTEPAACYTYAQHPTNAGQRMPGYRVVLPVGPADGPADHMVGMTVYAKSAAIPVLQAETEIIDLRWVSLRDRA